jgi:hypothetical protein
MKIWGIGQISNDERKDILDKHKSLYDGYRTMQPHVPSEQPLSVWDSAGDKGGITVNNRGEVKPYTNVKINESLMRESSHEIDEEKDMCECGGMMYEGECNECGWKMEEVDEEMQQVEDLDDVSDLNMSDSFDYVKGATNKTDSFKIKAHEDSSVDALAMQDVTGQEAPHMADNMAPDGLGDDSDNNRKMMADGEMEEQGGNADDMDVDDVASAYNFVSGGPMAGMDFPNYSEDESGETDFEDSTDEIDEDSFSDLINMDNELEDEREELEEEDSQYEYMESAWSDDEEMDDREELYPSYSDDEFIGMSKDSGDMEHIEETNDDGIPPQLARFFKKVKRKSKAEREGEEFDDNELDMSDYGEFEPNTSSWGEITAITGEDEFSHLDEDIKESVVRQKNRILEMMSRMKRF